MISSLEKFTKEFEKQIKANASLDETQTKAIEETRELLVKLTEELGKVEDNTLEIDTLISEELAKLTEKISSLEGFDVAKLTKLEQKIEKEIAGVVKANKDAIAENAKTNEKQDKQLNMLSSKLAAKDLSEEAIKIEIEALKADLRARKEQEVKEKTFAFKAKITALIVVAELLRLTVFIGACKLIELVF